MKIKKTLINRIFFQEANTVSLYYIISMTTVFCHTVWGNGDDWRDNSQNFTNFQRNETAIYKDGKSVLFDLAGNNSVKISGELKPEVVYAMPPKGKKYTWTGDGSLSGDMELWKSQNGTLSVNVPLNHKGKTYISEGILEINNTLAGPLEIRAKGTLSGNGILKESITFEGALNYEGCRIMPGTESSPFGKIEFGKSLNIDKEVYLEVDLKTGEDAMCDNILVNGDLNISGSLKLNFKCNEAKPEPGKYKLIEYKNEFTGDISKISVMGLSGVSYDIVNEDKQIFLVINAQRAPSDNAYWIGGVNTTLDFQTENLLVGENATSFVSDDILIFTDEAEKFSVLINEDLPSAGIKFINNTKNYTISGDGAFSGSAQLTKEGNGALILKTTKNSYTGATIINGGSVTVSELADGGLVSSIGASSSDASNLQIDNATLTVNNSNAATNRGLTISNEATINVPTGITSIKGIVKGSGTLVKSGSGQLNITYDGTNTWSGGTILKSGILAMGTWRSTFGTVGSKILAQGGTIQIFDNNSTSAVPTFKYNVEVEDGKTVQLNSGSRCNIQGSITGGGTFKINFPYVRADFQSDMKNFEGKIIASGSQFRLNQSTDMSKATLELSGNVYMAHFNAGSGNEFSGTTKIGGITGTSTTCSIGTGIYKIGYLGNDDSFAGKFGSSATVHKYGEGTLTLTGTSASALTVYEGTLMTKNTTSAITTGSITVSKGGKLSGRGKVSNVIINEGGIISAGINAYSFANLSIEGNCNIKKDGIISVRCKSSTNDYFNVSGNLTLVSPIIEMSLLSGSWSVGVEFGIFNVEGSITLSGEPTMIPAIPAEGMEWDYSDLKENGTIKVKVSTSIDEIKADNGPDVIYDLLGRKVEKAKKGIYIINNKKQIVE